MKLQLSKTLLITLSKNLNSANATWSLLTANEYLPSDDPLRKALVLKAKKTGANGTLFEAACNGKTLREIEGSETQEGWKRGLGALRHKRRPIPTPRKRTSPWSSANRGKVAVNF